MAIILRNKSRAAGNTPDNCVSVLDYGADPTSTLDSSDAIMEAINDHKNVYFPPGAYLTTKTIELPSKQYVSLLGSGNIYSSSVLIAQHGDHGIKATGPLNCKNLGIYRADGKWGQYSRLSIANKTYAFWLQDTDSLNGLPYTVVENCYSLYNYGGLRMQGTHQFARNCLFDYNVVGMRVLGGVHTLVHNATENNVAGLILEGNGHRVLSHYADLNGKALPFWLSGQFGYWDGDNFIPEPGATESDFWDGSIPLSEIGTISLRANRCHIKGVQFNANYNNQHFYLCGWQNPGVDAQSVDSNYIGQCQFYQTSARVTIKSREYSLARNNVIHPNASGFYTIIGNSDNNQFRAGWEPTGAEHNAASWNIIGNEQPTYSMTMSWDEMDANGQLIFNTKGTDFNKAKMDYNPTTMEARMQIVNIKLVLKGDFNPRNHDTVVRAYTTAPQVPDGIVDLVKVLGTGDGSNGEYRYGAEARLTAPFNLAYGTQVAFVVDSVIGNVGGSAIIHYRFIPRFNGAAVREADEVASYQAEAYEAPAQESEAPAQGSY